MGSGQCGISSLMSAGATDTTGHESSLMFEDSFGETPSSFVPFTFMMTSVDVAALLARAVLFTPVDTCFTRYARRGQAAPLHPQKNSFVRSQKNLGWLICSARNGWMLAQWPEWRVSTHPFLNPPIPLGSLLSLIDRQPPWSRRRGSFSARQGYAKSPEYAHRYGERAGSGE